MTEVLGRLYSWIAFLPNITISNILEILLISFLIYEILIWVQNTRAWVVLKGGLLIVIFYLAATILRFNTITWMISHAGQLALIALLIVFQPELRKALEQLGSKNIIADIFTSEEARRPEGFTEKTVNEIVRAVYEMGKVKTGALIVIEKENPLREIERTGIEVDGIVTSQLLINIFEHNTPLHDGAVVIRGNRITAATCYLPLSDNMNISKDLGTRHRAALGISESSDSITVVVSEETGRVTLAQGGTLTRMNDPELLRAALTPKKIEETATGRFKLWKGRQKNEGKTE